MPDGKYADLSKVLVEAFKKKGLYDAMGNASNIFKVFNNFQGGQAEGADQLSFYLDTSSAIAQWIQDEDPNLMPDYNTLKTEKMTVSPFRFFSAVLIQDYELQALTKDPTSPLGKATLEKLIKQVLSSFAMEYTRMFLGDKYSSFGTINGANTGTEFDMTWVGDVAFRNLRGRRVRIGTLVDLKAGNGEGSAVDLKVIGIKNDGIILNRSVTLADGDYIVDYYQYDVNAGNLKMFPGLLYAADDGINDVDFKVFQNLADRTVDFMLQGNTITGNASTLMTDLETAVLEMTKYAEDSDETLVAIYSMNKYNELVSQMKQDRKLNQDMISNLKLKNGFTGVEYVYQNKVIVIIPSGYVPTNVVYVVSKTSIETGVLTAPGFLTDMNPGGGALRVKNKGYEGLARWYATPLYNNPKQIAKILY